MEKWLVAIGVALAGVLTPLGPVQAQSEGGAGLVDLADPLVGTDNTRELSHGNLYPAICRPWGMNCWTVQTGPTPGSADSWIYKWRDNKIRGFRQTHQPSPWIGDYGTFSIMPTTGDAGLSEEDRESGFDHAQERAHPHYYRVRLSRYDTVVEMAPTERAAAFRIAYPGTDAANLIVDPAAGGRVEVVSEAPCRIVGFSVKRDMRWNEADDPGLVMTNWFVVTCDHPVRACVSNVADRCMAFLTFRDLAEGGVVNASAASSFVSQRQALANIKELGDGDFDRIVQEGADAWNDVLGRLAVRGGTEDERRMFYTCLYRSLLFPRKLYEIDEGGGSLYRDPNTGKVENGVYWCDTGFWDTFRALFPLLRLVYPEVGNSFLKGLEATYDATGWLPEWTAPGFRHCMVGNHSAAIVADAYFTGGVDSNVDFHKLYRALVHGANAVHPRNPHVGRLGWDVYNRKGYVPCDVSITQGAARTLEYAYDDWCIARLGEALGRPAEETAVYRARAGNWRNVFDTSRGWMNGRRSDGCFRTDFSPYRWGVDFTEGSTLHWTWCVLHDVSGLVDAMGGRHSFVDRLDGLFTTPPISEKGEGVYYGHENREMEIAGFGQYAHGNQPIQHALYLYAMAGAPEKTCRWVGQVRKRLYRPTPDGYCGDEDNGQTSSWYVWSCMGMYPVCPASGEYILGCPAFDEIDVRLGTGNRLVIRRDGRLSDALGSNVSLRGEVVKQSAIAYAEVAKGGTLSFEPPDEKSKGTAQRREISVSVIGLDCPPLPPVAESVPKIVKYWVDAIDREIGNGPDLVVLPEVCDIVPTASAAEKANWIRIRGDSVLDALKAYAAEHACYVVYSSYRAREDGRFANSSRLIDRGGAVVACYDKMFPTVGESGSRECPIVPGTAAVVAETDFGRVGFAICFDLNFPELRKMYAEEHPDVICFSSFFDGDFQQRTWARECQSYIVSATSANWLEKQVVDPAGGVLRCENYYMPTFTVRINTNCRVLHLDENREKFPSVLRKYGQRVSIRNPGRVGTVTISSKDPELPVDSVIREFGLESFSDYLDRSRKVREAALRQ